MRKYPTLHELATGEIHPIDKPTFVVGRSQQADLPVFDQQCSRQHFQIAVDDGQAFVEPLSATAQTRLNGQLITQRLRLEHGATIEAGSLQFRYFEGDSSPRPPAPPDPQRSSSGQPSVRPPEAFAPRPTGAPRSAGIPARPAAAPQLASGTALHDHTILAAPGAAVAAPQLTSAVNLRGRMVIGRDMEKADIHLPHPHVSRLHAVIVSKEGRAEVSDLGTTNGTFVDGQRISGPVLVSPGARIDIGPYTLLFDGNRLVPSSRADNVQLSCVGLTKVVADRTTGNPLTLLDDIHLVIRPREFVCILGPSGSGKSTLLGAMCARSPATSGRMLVNGQDLYANFESLKQDIALVPQKNILHESLSVERALWFTARLRLPADTTAAEIQAAVDEMLGTVGLLERRQIALRNLSGGQMRRACLAGEIIARPSLLFLDEVTSGLDEQTDGDMMDLFREIAESGKTVVCVTHSLAHVERACHLIVVLGVGGKLAFVGTPAEALAFFGISRLGEIYRCLAQRSGDEWRELFARSPLQARYIASRTAMLPQTPPPPAPQPITASGWKERAGPFARQTWLLLRRNFEVQLADRRALVMMLVQCLIVGGLIVLISEDIQDAGKDLLAKSAAATRALFLMAVSCFWFGCNNSVKEIVKERPIFEQERSVNLNIFSYYAAKALMLMVVSLIQATLLTLIVVKASGLPGDHALQWLVLSAVAATGVTLGLLISAMSQTEDVAVTTVPIVLVPQIILSGFVASLHGLGLWIARLLVTVYWAYRGLSTLLPDNYPVPDRDDISLPGSMAIVLLHAVVFAVATLAALSGGLAAVRRVASWLLRRK